MLFRSEGGVGVGGVEGVGRPERLGVGARLDRADGGESELEVGSETAISRLIELNIILDVIFFI